MTSLDLRTGHVDEAVHTLERALKSSKNNGKFRLLLAEVLAERGDTDKLRLQIEELRKIGYADALLRYFDAHFLINSSDFVKARQILVSLESEKFLGADLKANQRYVGSML